MAIEKLSKQIQEDKEQKIQEFLSNAATLPEKEKQEKVQVVLLRLPRNVIQMVDEKRKGLVNESRNLWIAKAIERALKD